MDAPDIVMARARQLFEATGLTLDELGARMGYEGDAARQSAWQFLNKTADPRLSMLRRFADAIGIPVADLLTKRSGSKMTTIPISVVGPGLEGLLRELTLHSLGWPRMVKRKDMKLLKKIVEDNCDDCELYVKTYPDYFPETKRLIPLIDELLKCRKLPTRTEDQITAFIDHADKARTRLISELNSLLEKAS